MIAHIVLFNPKPDLSVDQKRSFAQLLQRAGSEISTVRRAKVGRVQEIDAGYARGFGDKTYNYAAVLEFDDESGLVEYLNHPRHKELGRIFWELCESTTIVEAAMTDLSSDLSGLLG